MANITVCEAVSTTSLPAQIELQLREGGVEPTWAHIQILLSPVCLCLSVKEAIHYKFVEKPKRGGLVAPFWLCHNTGDPFPVGVSSPAAAWRWYQSKGEGFHTWGRRNPLAERFYPVRDRIVADAIEQLSRPAIVLPQPEARKNRKPRIERVANDYYPTPERYTLPLLERWQDWKETIVCDPCAGHGHISRLIPGCITNEFYPADDFLPDYCLDLYRSELYKTLKERRVETIITNPPYGNDGPSTLLDRLWHEAGVNSIAMLLRLNFLEPCDNRRELLQELRDHMRFVWPVNPRPRFRKDTGGGDNITVAWVVWQRKFSWTEKGIESPFDFLYLPKGAQA